MPDLSKGNTKTGRGVLTYSRAPGVTCPGASAWCAKECYAKSSYNRYGEGSTVMEQWDRNAETNTAPVLPPSRRDGKPIELRIHVSGDFDVAAYIHAWRFALEARPDVQAWAYTRSWRIPRLLKALEKLRALPNMQLFASTDFTIEESPPPGWRVASIAGDGRNPGPVCMEQTGKQPDCASCGYCFRGRKGNINFIAH